MSTLKWVPVHVVPVLVVACLVSSLAAAQTEGSLTGAPDRGRYPESRYIIGYGAFESTGAVSADQALQSARDKARAEIASFFSVRIDSSFSSLVSHVSLTRGEASGAAESSNVQDITRTQTSEVLEGVEIVATWREGRTYNAMAVMDRVRVADGFLASIAQTDREIAELVAPAGRVDSPVGRLRAINRAMLLSVVRKVQARKAQLVGATVPDVRFSESALLQMFDDAMKAAPVEVRVRGDGCDEIRAALASGLSARGFRVPDRGEPAAMVVDVDWTAARQGVGPQGFEYATWTMTLSVSEAGDAGSGNGPATAVVNLLTASRSGREGHRTPEGAIRRCVLAAVAEIGSGRGLASQVAAGILSLPGGQ